LPTCKINLYMLIYLTRRNGVQRSCEGVLFAQPYPLLGHPQYAAGHHPLDLLPHDLTGEHPVVVLVTRSPVPLVLERLALHIFFDHAALHIHEKIKFILLQLALVPDHERVVFYATACACLCVSVLGVKIAKNSVCRRFQVPFLCHPRFCSRSICFCRLFSSTPVPRWKSCRDSTLAGQG